MTRRASSARGRLLAVVDPVSVHPGMHPSLSALNRPVTCRSAWRPSNTEPCQLTGWRLCHRIRRRIHSQESHASPLIKPLTSVSAYSFVLLLFTCIAEADLQAFYHRLTSESLPCQELLDPRFGALSPRRKIQHPPLLQALAPVPVTIRGPMLP